MIKSQHFIVKSHEDINYHIAIKLPHDIFIFTKNIPNFYKFKITYLMTFYNFKASKLGMFFREKVLKFSDTKYCVFDISYN